jgi:flagellar FliJ protein
MAWIQSLIRLADLEIEQLQKRAKEIGDRRVAIEMVLAALEHEAVEEAAHAQNDAAAGFYLVGFREGWKLRKAHAQAQLSACKLEEQGVRDALIQAFEGQKKYENVAESERVAKLKVTDRRESAELDEIAMRKTGTR